MENGTTLEGHYAVENWAELICNHLYCVLYCIVHLMPISRNCRDRFEISNFDSVERDDSELSLIFYLEYLW